MPELKYAGFDEVLGGISIPGEPHLACVLLLDTSDSMAGEPINSLNKAISDFIEQLSLDEITQKLVDVAIIEFNDEARVVQEFTSLPMLQPLKFEAHGRAAMGAGIELAIDKVKERNRFYASMGTPCYKPWIFMITDGAPTDDITNARQRIIDEESKGAVGKLKFWAVGVPGYRKDTLTSLTKRCIALDEANFKGIFNWWSESMVFIGDSVIFKKPIISNKRYVEISLNDYSEWSNFPYGGAEIIRDIKIIRSAFISENIAIDYNIYFVDRCEGRESAFIVLQKDTGRIFLVVEGEPPYAFELLKDNDAALILDGEMVIEDIQWLMNKKIVVFHKHYILYDEWQKVVVDFESLDEHWVKEEKCKKTMYPQLPTEARLIPFEW